MPTSGIVSVTVFAPKAELADALATALFVMGETVGLNIINQMGKSGVSYHRRVWQGVHIKQYFN
jgi:thiamine biosynthesis lipoprotein ApbE